MEGKENVFTVIINDATSEYTRDNAFGSTIYSKKDDTWVSEAQEVAVKKQKRNARIAGPIELFRYAKIVDIFMILIGIVSAAVHGMCLPFLFVVYGTTLDEFAQYSITVFCEGNVTDNCTTRNAAKDNLIDNISHPIMLYYCIIGLVTVLSAWAQVITFQVSSGRQVKRIRIALFYSIMKQEIPWFDCNATGEINSRLNDDLEKIAAGTGEKLAYTIQAIVTIITGVVVGFIYLWQLALLIIGCAPILIIAGVFVERITTKITAAEQAQYARAGAVAQEVIGSIRTVIAYGGQEKEAQRYTQYLKGARRSGLKKEIVTGLTMGVYFVILFGIGGLAYWFCGYLITNVPSVSIRDVVITFFTLIMGAESLGLAISNIQDYSTARGAAGALFDIIDMELKILKSKGTKPKHFESDVTISYVSFCYPSRPAVQVLNQLNVSVRPGQTLALVGPSGCGKSTVVQLIQRFYDASEGRVKIGGYDVRELDVQWLRQQIGVVSQEPVLFATTIAENIRYGKEGVTQTEIEEAAKAANAHSFISELPDGYDTLVGERGTQLSGGQKQRIAIARALVRDPKILLLDEATSALDTESEAQVQAALDKARQGRTTIVIAHRLSTIQGAEIIAVISNGREAEVGTHAELLQMKGIYFDLIQSCKNESGADDDEIVAEMIKKYTTTSAIDDFTTADKVLQFKQGIPDRGHTLTRNEKQNAIEEEERDKEEEESGEEVTELIATYSTIKVFCRTLTLNKPEMLFIILGLVFAIISGLVYPSFAVFVGELLEIFTNRATAEKNTRFWAGLVAALGVCAATALFMRSWCFAIAGQALTSRLRKLSFKHILRQDMSWFDQPKNSTGKLTTRLSHDAAQVQGAVGVRFGFLIEIIVTFITAIVIAFYYSWSLTLLILGFLPFMIISLIFRGYIINGETTSSKKGYEESSYIAYEAIANIRTVKSLNLEEKMGNLFTEKLQAPYKKSMYLAIFYGFMYALSDGLIYFMYTAAFRFAAFLITLEPNNAAFTTYKEIVITVFALVIAAVQSARLSIFLPNYSKAILSARRIFKLLDVQPVIDSYSSEGLKPEEVKGNLELDKVYFTYPSRPNIPVLQGLTFSIEPGKMFALVGPSGCGKSTVVSLLERLYDPDNGLLKLDGNNLKSINVQWLRNQIGLVSQEPVLFDTTIADNIRYGVNFREVSDEEVEMAAKSANIHNFIMTLPQGYNTNVGLQGTQLSGGQKQRVAIARALIRDPKILLLDEATSALDAESEKVVQEALDNARKGRTSIVIAHRLSTIHNADCIAVIKDGVVIEAGIHNQLMEQRGAYYKLNKAQMLTTDN